MRQPLISAGFIKAECVSYGDFMEHSAGQKGMAAVKAAGKYRQEGKTYIVQDGDIIRARLIPPPLCLPIHGTVGWLNSVSISFVGVFLDFMFNAAGGAKKK